MRIPSHERYETATYVIGQVGNIYYVKRGSDGTIVYRGANAATVINWALSNLTPNRTWHEKVVVKGEFVTDI